VTERSSSGRTDFDVLALKTILAADGKNVVALTQDQGSGWKRLGLTMSFAADTATFNDFMLSPEGEIKYRAPPYHRAVT
jgi:hypothetical protein